MEDFLSTPARLRVGELGGSIRPPAARMVIFLDDARVNKIRATLQSLVGRPHCKLGKLLSLIGTLVFCATVIRLGKTHYRPLINLTVQHNAGQFARIADASGASVREFRFRSRIFYICIQGSRNSIPGNSRAEDSTGHTRPPGGK